VCRLGQFAVGGYALDGGAPSGPQALQLSDLVGLCRNRISGMAPKQLAEVVWALAQVCGWGVWGWVRGVGGLGVGEGGRGIWGG
jgi:hypothetical protein